MTEIVKLEDIKNKKSKINDNGAFEYVKINAPLFSDDKCRIIYDNITADSNTLETISSKTFAIEKDNYDEVIQRILTTKEWLEEFMTDIKYAKDK